MKKYLFLDIDGVLRSTDSPSGALNTTALAHLVRNHGLQVVITSEWRKTMSQATLSTLLGEVGRFVVGVTPDLYAEGVLAGSELSLKGLRQMEVQAWIDRNVAAPCVRLAIDDTITHYEMECPWLFLTHPKYALNGLAMINFDAWVDLQSRRQQESIERQTMVG